MSPSPNTEHTPPVSNLALLHQQQRARGKVHDSPQHRGRNTSRYELGRRDRLGERVTRIYPREMYVTVYPLPMPEKCQLCIEQSLLQHRPVSRLPLLQVPQPIMRPRLRSCPLWAPPAIQQPSTQTSGPNRYPTSPTKLRQTTAQA